MPALCDDDCSWNRWEKGLHLAITMKTGVYPIPDSKQLFNLDNLAADYSLLNESE